MIIKFSLENFGPIKGRQELSFEPEKSNHLKEHYVVNNEGIDLLKIGLIYGANASGKTTILKALNFLRELVLEPVNKKTDILDFKPFLFDEQTPKNSSVITIEFIKNKIKYNYEVEFTKKAIVREELNFYNPKKASLFKRKTDLDNQFSEIKFGNKVKLDKTDRKVLESNTLWNNTVLGGYLKKNIEFPEIKEVIDWFSENLKNLVKTKSELFGYTTKLIDTSIISKDDVLFILRQADFHVSDILIREDEDEIPDGFLKFLKENSNVPKNDLEKLEVSGKVKSITLELEHTVNDKVFTLPFEDESEGTRRYFGLAGLLTLLIKQSTILPIDELESSLHPDLFKHFLLSFLQNSSSSQIIATTHNREILSDKDIFRDDAIWITEKSEDGSTELYSMGDFDSSVIRDSTNRLNAYKSGKLGGVPNLGDHYIEIN